MAVTDWSETASSNTTLGSVPLGENLMDPGDVNDAFRELMAQIASGISDGDFAGDVSDKQPLDATLTALAGVTTAANKLIYASGSDAFTTTDLTAYGRTLLGLADAAALRTNIGAVTVTAASLSATGYVKLNISGTDFIIQWGSAVATADGTTSVSFPTSFSSFSRTVASGAVQVSSAQSNNPGVISSGLSSFSLFSANPQAVTVFYIAVGV